MREHLAEMVGGPGAFRFFVQPVVAVVLGVLHGLRDYREGRPAYLIGVIRAREGRWRRIGEALRDIAIPLSVALALSYSLQYVIRSRISFSYGFLFAAVLVATPYIVTRGLANRVANLGQRRQRA